MSSTTYTKGRYQAEILEQGFEESPSKKTPGFYLQLKILARYDAQGALQACPQYERTCTQWLANEKGVDILRGDLKALGVEITDLTQLEPGAPGQVNLLGRTIDVVCDLENYQGKQVERWSIQRAKKKLSRDAVLALNDKFGHLLRDGGGQVKPDTAVTESNDSDVPF